MPGRNAIRNLLALQRNQLDESEEAPAEETPATESDDRPYREKARDLIRKSVGEAGLSHGKGRFINDKPDKDKAVSERDFKDLVYGVQGGRIKAEVYWYPLGNHRGGYASIGGGPTKHQGGLDDLIELIEKGRTPSKIEQRNKKVLVWARAINRQYVIKLK
jgi:hypothetical protein